MSEYSSHLLSRRNCLLWGGITAGSLLGGSQLQAAGEAEPEELPQTPEEALERLYAGNGRFASGKSLAIHRDLDRVKQIADKQTPFAAFLGCADSRVPIEFVFDQGFGDLFVTRIAGNIASSENIGSLEFSAHVLQCKVIYVLGHSQCGAVKATLDGQEVPGQISGLFQYIRPAVKQSGGDLERAITENVRNQAAIIAEASPLISRLIQRKMLIVAGGVYDLATGRVTPLDPVL